MLYQTRLLTFFCLLCLYFSVNGFSNCVYTGRAACREEIVSPHPRSVYRYGMSLTQIFQLKNLCYTNRNDAVPMRQETIHPDCNRDNVLVNPDQIVALQRFASALWEKFAVRLQILGLRKISNRCILTQPIKKSLKSVGVSISNEYIVRIEGVVQDSVRVGEHIRLPFQGPKNGKNNLAFISPWRPTTSLISFRDSFFLTRVNRLRISPFYIAYRRLIL